MFGDIAHGGILFAFGLYLIFNDEKIKKSPLKLFSLLRYMITMMGFFAFYCGFIYNDFMGFNLNIFGTCVTENIPPALSDEEKKKAVSKIFHFGTECVYPIGIDPVWGRS